jgi:hypothetical protein
MDAETARRSGVDRMMAPSRGKRAVAEAELPPLARPAQVRRSPRPGERRTRSVKERQLGFELKPIFV